MLCILYVIAISTALGIIAHAVERILPPSWARRWTWCAAIVMSVVLPPVYRARHMATVGGEWLSSARTLDSTINRVWLTLSALVLIWGIANAARVAHLVHRARTGVSPDGTAVVDGVPVLITNALGPATVGLLRSQVLLPRWVFALPEAERRYVVQHEEEHRRAHDVLLLLVASLPIVLLPWNPALWWQLRRLSLAVEMDCDTRVVRALGDAPTYGALLLKVAEAANHGPRLQPALLGVGALERRLTLLLAPEPLRRAQRVLLPVLAFGLLYLVFAMPHPVVEHGAAMRSSVGAK